MPGRWRSLDSPATQKQWAYDPAQVLNASTPTHRPDVTKD